MEIPTIPLLLSTLARASAAENKRSMLSSELLTDGNLSGLVLCIKCVAW